jgi:hypothetical protein
MSELQQWLGKQFAALNNKAPLQQSFKLAFLADPVKLVEVMQGSRKMNVVTSLKRLHFKNLLLSIVYFNDIYRRFCFGDAAFTGRLNPKQFELAFQASGGACCSSSKVFTLMMPQELLTSGRGVADVFKEIDDDGSGFISFQEICVYLLQHQPPQLYASLL